MKKVLKTVLGACILCVVLALIIGVVGFFFYPPLGKMIEYHVRRAYRSMPVRISCAIPIPPEHGALVFLRYGIHPSLAAYDYKLKITRGSTTVERSMPSSSNPSIRVNAYWYPADQHGGPWIRLQDREGEHLVNIGNQKISRILRHKGHVFSGELSSGQEGTAMVESGGKILVSVGRGEAREITGLSIGDSPGTYIGRIEGNLYRLRFITSDQSPEKRIGVLE